MRKIISVMLALALTVSLCGCAGVLPDGYDTVRAAKEKYENLDSGRAVMTDLDSGELIMDFSFMINPNNEMVLNFYGKDGDNEMFAYSNGAEYFYKENGAEMWSVIAASDENYIYNLYNRENRYPYATDAIFFFDGGSVEAASVIESDDGLTHITYTYDADKLNKNLEDTAQSYKSLTTVFDINQDGYITDFTQSGVISVEGTEKKLNFKISIQQMNKVYDIPYPVDQVIKS